MIATKCSHLDSINRENNVVCLQCANSRLNLETSHGEESSGLIDPPPKSKLPIIIFFTVSILLIVGLYIHALTITDEYISMLILAKKVTDQGSLQQIQILSAIALSCSAIVSGYLCFSKDYSKKVQGWTIVGMIFLCVCTLNLLIAFDQWINKYQ